MREYERRRRRRSRQPSPDSPAMLQNQPGQLVFIGRNQLLTKDGPVKLTSSRILTGAKSIISPLFNLTTMELSCMGGTTVKRSSIVHSSLLNKSVTVSRSASTVARAFGPSLAAPARTFSLTFKCFKVKDLLHFLTSSLFQSIPKPLAAFLFLALVNSLFSYYYDADSDEVQYISEGGFSLSLSISSHSLHFIPSCLAACNKLCYPGTHYRFFQIFLVTLTFIHLAV